MDEKIISTKCPVLNKSRENGWNSFGGNFVLPLEVLVKFDSIGVPQSIICEEYDNDKCKLTDSHPCIYSKWKDI